MSFKIRVLEKSFEERVLEVLPDKYAKAFYDLPLELRTRLTEIRIRADNPCSFTVGGNNIPMICDGCPVCSDIGEIEEIVERLCLGSVYSCVEYISLGYIPYCGTRIGIGGDINYRADGKRIFTRITSLSIRIPGYVPSAAEKMIEYIKGRGVENTLGTIAVSAPNNGKTTFLRAFAASLSNIYGFGDGNPGMRVCIIDERNEIYTKRLFSNCFCDVISGIPKPEAAMMAIRSLSPQVLVFDEIGDEREAEILAKAHCGGVYILGSFHGNSISDMLKKPGMKKLVDSGVFKTAFLLERKNGDVVGNVIQL